MKLQYSLSALILCTFLAAVAVRGGQWTYENVWVPAQPIAWVDYSPDVLADALASQRPVLLHFMSERGEVIMAVPLNTVYDMPSVRQAIYRNRAVPILVDTDRLPSDIRPVGDLCIARDAPLTVIYSAESHAQPLFCDSLPSARTTIAALEVAAHRRHARG